VFFANAGTGSETILVVEDEARVLKLISGILSARGYTVLEAGRGAEARRAPPVTAINHRDAKTQRTTREKRR